MKQNAVGQGGQQTFTFTDPAILIGAGLAVYFLGSVAWYFAHTEIAALYVYLRYGQLWLLNFVAGLVDLPGLSGVHQWIEQACAPLSPTGPCSRDFSTVEWDEISDSTVFMNLFFLILLVVICVRCFRYLNAHHPNLRFVKTHNIKSFVNENKERYPHLRIFSELDLINEPLDHPIFGMSLTSRQFAYKHRLISGWKQEVDGSWTPTLDRERATHVFWQQLGKHWTKSTDLSPAETILAAIAIPRVAATDPEFNDVQFKEALQQSNNLIKWCWDQFVVPPKKKKLKQPHSSYEADPYAWLRPELDLAYPREIILKYISHPAVQVIIEQHAFNRTIIFALFMQARRLGVLQPAELRWMRYFDRELWYVLENIGRQSGFGEGAAVLAHLLYESKSRSAIAEPQLDKAVNGLDTALTAFKFLTQDKDRYESGQL